ncbi:hypothetical protein ECPA3_5831, partial [Escherichia coli PA3]
MFHTPAQPF